MKTADKYLAEADIRGVISKIEWSHWPRICQYLAESDLKLASYIRLNLDAEIQELARKQNR